MRWENGRQTAGAGRESAQGLGGTLNSCHHGVTKECDFYIVFEWRQQSNFAIRITQNLKS